MSDPRFFVGNFGHNFLVSVQDPTKPPVDITGMTVALLVWKPGALTFETWPATVSGTDSIAYKTIAGNFSVAGEYRFEAHVYSADGITLDVDGITWFETVYEKGN